MHRPGDAGFGLICMRNPVMENPVLETASVTERVRWWKPAGMDGIEILSVSRSPRLWKVFHETYSICTVTDLEGGLEWAHRGRRHRSAGGSLMLIDQGEAHSACHRPAPVSFWVLMIEPRAMAALAREKSGPSVPRWKVADVRDPEIFGAFQSLHRTLASNASLLERESRLVDCVTALLGRFTESTAADGIMPSGVRAPESLRRARDFLHARFQEEISLTELAQAAGLSRSYLCRFFAREFGLPPHQYQVRLRLNLSRKWLAMGRPFSAPDLGFCDQSQFIREFKSNLGMTPGRYPRDLRRPIASHELQVG